MTFIPSNAVRYCAAGALSLLVAAATVVASAEADQRDRRGQSQPPAAEQGGSYNRADVEVIVGRLYRAVLGRDADPSGLNAMVDNIQRGNMEPAVQGLFDSSEFRGSRGAGQPDQVLDRLYRGLLNRAPDAAGIRAFLPRIERQQYTSVVFEIMASPEFAGALSAPPQSSRPAPAPAAPPPAKSVNRLESALDCQMRVIDAARREAGGRVFLTFDRMPDVSADGQTVQGPGVDRFNNLDRQLTYRCGGRDVTYVYSDRRPPVAADPRLAFPSAAVRNCQNAVRDGLVFDVAALSASDTNAEYVLGIAGGTPHVCQMNGMRIVSAK